MPRKLCLLSWTIMWKLDPIHSILLETLQLKGQFWIYHRIKGTSKFHSYQINWKTIISFVECQTKHYEQVRLSLDKKMLFKRSPYRIALWLFSVISCLVHLVFRRKYLCIRSSRQIPAICFSSCTRHSCCEKNLPSWLADRNFPSSLPEIPTKHMRFL